MKNETTPDYMFGGMYYSKFFDTYLGAEETGEYLAVLPIEERLSYIDALPEEEEFLAVLPPNELAKYYVSIIGYDPFEDDPKATVGEVRQTLREHHDAETAAYVRIYGPINA